MIKPKLGYLIGIVIGIAVLFVAWDAGYFQTQDVHNDYIGINTFIAHYDDFKEGDTVRLMGEVTRIDTTTAGINIFLDGDTTQPLFYDVALHGVSAPTVGDNVALIGVWHTSGNPEITSWVKLNTMG
jgi:hypothetical protein